MAVSFWGFLHYLSDGGVLTIDDGFDLSAALAQKGGEQVHPVHPMGLGVQIPQFSQQ